MADQINFAAGTDTGEADSLSIRPLESGEPFDTVAFNRPVNHLRQRTDALRHEANANRLLRDLERFSVLYLTGAPPSLTWAGTVAGGGTGIVSLSSGSVLTLVSGSTGGVTRSAYFDGAGTRFPTRFAHLEVTDGVNHTIQIVADVAAYDGGNEITISVTDVPASGAIAISVGGDGSVADPSVLPGADNIVVTYDSNLGHTIASVISAVNAHPAAGALVTLTYTGAGSTADGMFDVALSSLAGGLDGLHYRISASVLSAFFAASTENLLREGDTLAIAFASDALMRQATQENADACDIVAGSLINLTREPERARHAIPLGKVIADTFVLANGVTLAKGVAVSTVTSTDTTLRADLARDIVSVPAVGANGFGSEIVSVDTGALAAVSPATKDLQTVLEAIDDELTDIATDVTTLEGAVDLLEGFNQRVSSLWSVPNLPTTLGVSSAATDGVTFEFYRSGIRPAALTQVATSSTSGTLAAVAAGDVYWYASDGTSVFAHLLEDVASASLTPDATLALANVVEISVCTNTVALRMSDDTVALYNADLSTALLTKTDLGLVSGSELANLVNRGEYLYVTSYVEAVPGTHQWNLTAVPTTSFTPATSTMLTSSDVDEFSWLALEADRRTDLSTAANRDVFVLHEFDGSGTPGYRVRRAVFNGSTFSFSSDIGDAGTSPTAIYGDGAGFVLLPDFIVVSGRNIGSGGADIVALHRHNLAQALAPSAIIPADGGTEHVGILKADSRYIYAVRSSDNSSGAFSTIIIYPHDLSTVVAALTLAGPTVSNILGLGSTDEYLVVGYQGAGQPEYRAYTLNPPSRRYAYSDKGRAPLWMRYERME